MLLGSHGTNDLVYSPNYNALSHSQDWGKSRRFGRQLGRVEVAKIGSRAAADGCKMNMWRPEAPPNDSLCRPSSASSGVHFAQQTTRIQDVTGKLLEDNAMTRFLFNKIQTGTEYYEGAYDSLTAPGVNRRRVGSGHHKFRKQTGRLSMAKSGSRAAAMGAAASYWEPGMGYTETMANAGQAAQFQHMTGRVDLHLSGMRGAPAKPSEELGLAKRPMSAMAALREPGQPKPRAQSAMMHRPMTRGVLPVRHVMVPNMDRQMSRDAWASKIIR
jgi:hypothetical protein